MRLRVGECHKMGFLKQTAQILTPWLHRSWQKGLWRKQLKISPYHLSCSIPAGCHSTKSSSKFKHLKSQFSRVKNGQISLKRSGQRKILSTLLLIIDQIREGEVWGNPPVAHAWMSKRRTYLPDPSHIIKVTQYTSATLRQQPWTARKLQFKLRGSVLFDVQSGGNSLTTVGNSLRTTEPNWGHHVILLLVSPPVH